MSVFVADGMEVREEEALDQRSRRLNYKIRAIHKCRENLRIRSNINNEKHQFRFHRIIYSQIYITNYHFIQRFVDFF